MNVGIFEDFGNYLIQQVRPMYASEPIPDVDIDNEVFALDSTTISLSLKPFSWAYGKYSRGAVKIHTLLDLRGSIPTYILIQMVNIMIVMLLISLLQYQMQFTLWI